jgi:signal transduction histidine kinase
MRTKRELKRKWGLTISLVIFVFAVILAALLLAGLLVVILYLLGVLQFGADIKPEDVGGFSPLRILLPMIAFSTVMGPALAAFFSKKALKPITKVIEATRKIATGDFNIRVEIGGIYELEELAKSFNKMVQELSSLETLRSDFVNNISHEFKTPIVSIRGFAKLLKDDNLSDAERREYLDIIITEAERLSQLSTNILHLSKYESMEIIGSKSSFRLDEQIRRAVVMTEPKWSVKQLDLEVEMDEVCFTGNEDLTQQIWLNLLDNAIKFTDEGGTVSIRLSDWNNGYRLCIRDTGIGMDEETISRVFDRFFQDDNSRAGAGNGLGLAIVKRIVDLYDGTMEVKSKLGVGSEFIVWLPRV